MPLNLSAVGKKIGPFTRKYEWKDFVLYGLGVGAGFDDLEYVYENKLKVIPSFAVLTVYGLFADAVAVSGINLAGILHGEQDLFLHAPIHPDGVTLTTEGRITHMYDKGKDKGALIIAEADSFDENGCKLFTNVITIFAKRDGGFGGEESPKETFEFPDREPDFEETANPSPDQPLVYRLSGDTFALHVDPNFARASGFEMPIMHGLCTHGYACRAVIKHLFPGEPERMTRFKVRFSKHLYPGKAVKTQIWKVEEGKALFRTVNVENDEIVLDRGIATWISREEAERRAKLGAIHFDGRVALVTGAGRGLGKIYALEMAKRGAKVVVNDLGGAADGSGTSSSPADEVVREIREAGGEAIANYDSVATPEGGQSMVQAALDRYGRIDILINNAGILRDKSFTKMTPQLWEDVLNVHLQGAYNVTQPAYLAMRESGYGRIVLTTSAAGLHGNFGQANYGSAKMGLVGFMNTLKLEAEKYDIKVNTIAPVATTRLTEDLLPPDFHERLKPEFVAPLVLYLCSDQCPVTGKIYNAGMGQFSRVAMVSGAGAWVKGKAEIPTPEEVAAGWNEIVDLEDAQEYANANAAIVTMLSPPAPGKKAKGKKKKEKEEEKKKGFSSAQDVFDLMPKFFLKEKAAGVDVVFQFTISGSSGGDWQVLIKDQACTVEKGVHGNPTTILKMADEDFLALMAGQLPPMKAFTSGKLRIEGDMMKSQLVEKLFKF